MQGLTNARLMNNTYIYDSTVACPNASSTFCATWHGGWYDGNSSSTYAASSNQNVPDDNINEGGDQFNTSDATWITEDLKIAPNVTLSKFPVGLPNINIGGLDYDPEPILGLGSGSTVLNSLLNSNYIAGRVWSMFWGLTGASQSSQMPGSFIMGGYDASRVQDEGYNFTISKPGQCDYLVTIKDIRLDFPNGTATSIFTGSQSTVLTACIDPSFPVLMTLPYDNYYENFEAFSGMSCNGRSFGLNFYGMTCDSSQPLYQGDLTIEIQGGPNLTVPNDQLLIPDVTLDSAGDLQVNYSNHELMINSLQDLNKNDAIQLGRQFLSAAYMMANLDTNQFTLWPANTASGHSPQLIAVDKKGQASTSFCSGNRTGSSANTTTPAISTKLPSTSHSKLSSGAIAGIVIGIVFGLAALAISTVVLIRRYQSRRALRGNTQQIVQLQKPDEAKGNPGPSGVGQFWNQNQNQHQHNYQPVEMPEQQSYPHEMPAQTIYSDSYSQRLSHIPPQEMDAVQGRYR